MASDYATSHGRPPKGEESSQNQQPSYGYGSPPQGYSYASQSPASASAPSASEQQGQKVESLQVQEQGQNASPYPVQEYAQQHQQLAQQGQPPISGCDNLSAMLTQQTGQQGPRSISPAPYAGANPTAPSTQLPPCWLAQFDANSH